MIITDLIAKKRDQIALQADEINFLVNGFVRGSVKDYQMSALAMAIRLRGMTTQETVALTRAMLRSGKTFSPVSDKPRVDKHSTGGVGDKISLVLAPLLAAAGAEVPMISGRGLGHTGGTLDKLESIDGFCCELDEATRNKTLRDVGAFIVGADETIAPADRKLYALRDVTATVDSMPLITASILSKKLAAGLDALVMDVKVGAGAFMKTVEEAEALSNSLIEVGCGAGLPTAAMISDMDQPVGRAIGNAIEVNEAVEVLSGAGPSSVRELTIELAAELLTRADLSADGDQARHLLNDLMDQGDAMEVFQRMVAAQGGRWSGPLPVAKPHPLVARRSGWIQSIDCLAIAGVVQRLGGGRFVAGDSIDPSVGVVVHQRVGDAVNAGDVLLTVHAHDDSGFDYLGEMADAVMVAEQPCAPRPMIIRQYPFDGPTVR